MHLQVNAVGKSDGFIQVYLNGTKVIEVKDVIFRASSVSSSSLLITDIAFSTFFGGATLPYAAPSDTYTIFRNMNMSVSNNAYVFPQPDSSAHGNFMTLGWLYVIAFAYLFL